MTQEQDIVERLLDAWYIGTPIKGLLSEAAQTIAALRAERDSWAGQAMREDDCRLMWQERAEAAEAAEAKVKELEAVVRSLQKELKRSAEAGMRVMDQRTTAIRERDELRKALEPFAKAADGVGTIYGDDFKLDRREVVHAAILITIGDLRRARSASSNREGGEE